MSKIKEIKKLLNDESGKLAVEVLNKVKAIVERDDGPKPLVAVKAVISNIAGPLNCCKVEVHKNVKARELSMIIEALTEVLKGELGEKNE